jgi:hypothetical protein
MQCTRRGSLWSLRHVNRDNDLLPTALGFFTPSAPRAFRSVAYNVLVPLGKLVLLKKPGSP